jgi:excisionase family DNA binding protein
MTYLTIAETAARLGVSRARVHQLIELNRLTATAARLGQRRLTLVDEGSVERRLETLPNPSNAAYLTIPRAAKHLNRSPDTLRRWIKSGRLPAVKQHNQWVVSVDDLNAINPPRRGRPRKDQP